MKKIFDSNKGDDGVGELVVLDAKKFEESVLEIIRKENSDFGLEHENRHAIYNVINDALEDARQRKGTIAAAKRQTAISAIKAMFYVLGLGGAALVAYFKGKGSL